jgi:hypothetical protein
MPWTLPMVRARVRRELGDTEAARLWTDERVADQVADAIRELGQLLPRGPAAVTLAATAGQREYALGVEALRVVAVEWPPGTMLPRERGLMPASGSPEGPAGGYAQAWTADARAGTIRLRNAPGVSGESIRVLYVPPIAVPANDGDAIGIEEDEGALVALLACRSLWELRRLDDAKRGLRTPGAANPFAGRVEAMLGRRRRRVRAGVMSSEQ